MSKNFTQKSAKKRETSIDMLRGIAVFLMVLAHAIAFFYSKEDGILKVLQNFGDTLCFTIFLLVSGTSSYFAYLRVRNKKWRSKKKRLLIRIMKLLFIYYLVALVSSINNFVAIPANNWPEGIFKILAFINVPGYTEFLLPFIFYGLLILAFRSLLKKMARYTDITLMVAWLSYNIGCIIHQISLPEPFVYYKALIAGEADWFRFPLLQYFGIFLIGILLGKFLQGNISQKKRQRSLANFSLLSLLSLIFALALEQFLQFPYSQEFQRWPPSISFLSLGISFSFVILILIKIKINTFKVPKIKSMLEFFGKYAFAIYTLHIVILQLENLLLGLTFSTIWLVLLSFILLLSACVFLVLFIRILRYN